MYNDNHTLVTSWSINSFQEGTGKNTSLKWEFLFRVNVIHCQGYIQTRICSYFLPFFCKIGKENPQWKLAFNVSESCLMWQTKSLAPQFLDRFSKTALKYKSELSLIQREEFITSVVQEFFQIRFTYATWKPSTTAYIPQTVHRHILLAGSLDKRFSVQAALIYPTFLNSTQSSTPSKLELKAMRKVFLALISSTVHPHIGWQHLFSVSGSHHNFRSHWFCPTLYSTGLSRQWWDAASTLTFNSCLFFQVAASESNRV